MLVLLGYADVTATISHQQVLEPREGVKLDFVFGTDLPRPPGVDSIDIVFRIVGDDWFKDETAIIRTLNLVPKKLLTTSSWKRGARANASPRNLRRRMAWCAHTTKISEFGLR